MQNSRFTESLLNITNPDRRRYLAGAIDPLAGKQKRTGLEEPAHHADGGNRVSVLTE